MSRTKIAILGKLSLSEDDGLLYSVSSAKPSSLSPSIRASARSLTDRTELRGRRFRGPFRSWRGPLFGMKQIAVSGRPADRADVIELAFAGDDHLFVPVELSHSVQKYKGADSKPPKLAALGVAREPCSTVATSSAPATCGKHLRSWRRSPTRLLHLRLHSRGRRPGKISQRQAG